MSSYTPRFLSGPNEYSIHLIKLRFGWRWIVYAERTRGPQESGRAMTKWGAKRRVRRSIRRNERDLHRDTLSERYTILDAPEQEQS